MTDLVGFTPSAAQLTAADLVAELNDLFTRFDAACARRGVEKIKTIGDAYMAVAGLDRDDSTASRASVTSAASLALDMFEALVTSGARWQMRIGIHAGPVVAGVIGTRKFAYDVWGDTVNVASRLESTSQPGRIQVSKVVADALESDFLLEPRGKVDLKGKGQTATWFLVGHR
jgi:class 3 adenylate cyclase